MSKVTFTNTGAPGSINQSFITISAGNGGNQNIALANANAQFRIQAPIGTNVAPCNFGRVSQIEVQAGNNLHILGCNDFISDVSVDLGTIDFCNNYQAGPGELTNIVVGNNSIVNITGTGLCIGSLTLNLNSTINFTHNNHNCHIKSPGMVGMLGANSMVQIHDIDKCLTICEFIANKFATATPFALDEVCYLRDYQGLNHNFVSLFMQQNGMVSTDVIDKFIAQNYFEFTAITHDHNLTGSSLEGAGPYDVLGEICSWIDLSDVNLS